MTVHADFTSQEFFRNPSAEIERLRALGPVIETRFPIVGRVWITTTAELILVGSIRSGDPIAISPSAPAAISASAISSRIEGKCALQALLTRWPKLELAVSEVDIRWRERPGLRAIADLPVMAGAR